MEIISAATLLFLVMDPLGNIPIFLSVLEDVAPERRTRVLIRELILAFIVLLFLLFFGKFVIGFLQLTEHSIRIAGGIILFLIALKMVFPVKRFSNRCSCGKPKLTSTMGWSSSTRATRSAARRISGPSGMHAYYAC